MAFEPDFRRIPGIELQLGESPVWDGRRQRLWFVDILRPAIAWYDPRTEEHGFHAMPAPVGCLALSNDRRLLLGLSTGVHYFDPADGSFEFLVHPEPDRPMNRLNDGRVGPDGHFWIGSMHDAMPRLPTGALYRIAPDGTCARVIDGICASNGLAWSPDAMLMYHADSRASPRAGRIMLHDFDAGTGAIRNGRILASPTEEEGLPDGAAVDTNGIYWSAGLTAGCLNGFDPSGKLISRIALPVEAPTMPCFGGGDLSTVFLTSLTRPGDIGSLSRMDIGRRGLSESRFATPSRAAAKTPAPELFSGLT